MSAGTQTKYYLNINGKPISRVKEALYTELKKEPNTYCIVRARDTDNFPIDKTVELFTVSGSEIDEILDERYLSKGFQRNGRTLYLMVKTEKQKTFTAWNE